MENNICSVCEIAESIIKCELCDNLICEDCMSFLDIRITNIKSILYGNDVKIGRISICENCRSKIGKINPSSLIDKDTKEDIINKIKKNFIVINLDDN